MVGKEHPQLYYKKNFLAPIWQIYACGNEHKASPSKQYIIFAIGFGKEVQPRFI